MAKANTTDLYMQFKDATVTTDAADSTTVAEGTVKTGISLRGSFAWLIHLVEVIWPVENWATQNAIQVCISGIAAQAVMPALGGRGTLVRAREALSITTSGAIVVVSPQVLHYLPPIPFASPDLSVYIQTDVDQADLRGLVLPMRIGFTTEPMTPSLVREIAEVWGY